MSALDKNKIFFGLIHYILSEQKNVNWILKTSLINFTGINSTVSDKKYEKKSLSDDIIDYIYQVKPYHVQFEQFIEKYSNKQDTCNILPQDANNIELNVRFDSVTSQFDEYKDDDNDIDFMDTHAANRLWVIKHKNFSEEEIKDYINDVLNCHFKGITVDGSNFDIDKYGYDTFLYDEKLYDAPTISEDYYIIDNFENIVYPYTKEYVNVGISTLKLNSEKDISQLKVYRNGIEEQFSYNTDTKVLTLKKSINLRDKILVENSNDGIRNGMVFVGISFIESEDGTNIRKFKDINDNKFYIPNNQFDVKKIIVHIQYPNGTRIPTYNYEKVDNYIVIKDELKEHYHVIITVIDYAEIYDKIYNYEDCYGQSNNLISLDGNEFLRPYYEKERPSELLVSYPISNLKIYTYLNDKIKSMNEINHKHDDKKVSISKSMITTLKQDLNVGDKIIMVDNIKKLRLPYTNDSNILIPGKILINSEMIEFYDYDEKENVLKSIRRGVDGSFIAEKHEKNSDVINYNENTEQVYDYYVPYISQIYDGTQNSYIIPEKYISDDRIKVWKHENIELLTDIKLDSEYFIISSNNIDLPILSRGGILYINDDKIIYNKIEEVKYNNKKAYKISEFNIDKEYSINDSVIHASKPILLNASEYIINDTTVKLKENPKIGEIITITNELI